MDVQVDRLFEICTGVDIPLELQQSVAHSGADPAALDGLQSVERDASDRSATSNSTRSSGLSRVAAARVSTRRKTALRMATEASADLNPSDAMVRSLS